MHGHEVIIRLLQAAGVQTVFQFMAEDTMNMMSDLETNYSETFNVVHARHEQGAVIMADGYSRSTSNIGVCVVGRGPGIGQTGTGLINAQKHGSRLLVFVPEPPLADKYDTKEFDQDTFLQSTVKEVVRIRSERTVVGKFREALRRVHLGDSPIAVQIPWDLLDTTIDIPSAEVDTFDPTILSPQSTNGTVVPDPETIETAVEYYLDSDAFQPPVIIAGQGAIQSGAKAPIESLAERINAVLATTLAARDYFVDHPYHVGFTGNWGSPLANKFLTEASYVIGVGASLNYNTLDHGYLINDEATLIHIDTDPNSIGRYTPVDLAIVADATTGIQQLDDAFNREGIHRQNELWTEDLRDRIADYSILDGPEFPEQDGTMDPREVIRKFDDLLPPDRLVGTDGGHFRKWVLDGITASPPNSIVACDFSAVGVGLPMSVGAAQALAESPDDTRNSILFCGDAGFMMSLQELETAARKNHPLLVIILNDSSLGAEYHAMDGTGFNPEVALIPTPEFADVADALGATGKTVRSLDELNALADTFDSKLDGPMVIDCKINPLVRHRTF